MNLSITPNTKITQYLERKKNINHYKSPSNLLNKSQNVRQNQKISKINLKNYIMNKKLNRRNFNHKSPIIPKRAGEPAEKAPLCRKNGREVCLSHRSDRNFPEKNREAALDFFNAGCYIMPRQHSKSRKEV